MVHARVWKFCPEPAREEEFAAAYGPGGPWEQLFARAEGYRGTVLLRPSEPGGCWLTIDFWRSVADFEAFGRDHGADYRYLDAELEGISGEEEFMGAFEVGEED